MSEIPDKRPTLWDRVEYFLKDQPWAVVILLLVVILGGIKTIVEATEAVTVAYRNIWPPNDPKRSYVLSCSQFGQVKSGPAVEPDKHTMYVTNSSNSTPLELTWINGTGKPDPKYHFSIPRGGYLEESTFASHVWLISDAKHHCLGIVKLGSQNVHVDEPDPEGKPAVRPIESPN